MIDLIQLHGSEDEDYIKRLRAVTKKPIIKAVIVSTMEDVTEAEQSCAEYLLFDGGRGSATGFDYQLIRQVNRPYFLAGGLTEENVVEALRMVSPYGVDISSGIETNQKKDMAKAKRFLAMVRNKRK